MKHVGEYFARDEERGGREASQIKTSAKFNMSVVKTCGRREKRGWRELGFGARHRLNMFKCSTKIKHKEMLKLFFGGGEGGGGGGFGAHADSESNCFSFVALERSV